MTAQSALSAALSALNRTPPGPTSPTSTSAPVSPPSLASAADSDSLDDDAMDAGSPLSLSDQHRAGFTPGHDLDGAGADAGSRTPAAAAKTPAPDAADDGAAADRPAAPTAPSPARPSRARPAAVAAVLTRGMVAHILASQGPLAIRHLIAQLCLSSRAFAELSPGRQRRAVVHMLESPPTGPSGAAGVSPTASAPDDDDYVFEKVGWGRWAACRRGRGPATHPPSYGSARSRRNSSSHTAPSSFKQASSFSSFSFPKLPLSPSLGPVDDTDPNRFYATESSIRHAVSASVPAGAASAIRIENNNFPRRRGSSVVTTSIFSPFEGDLMFSSSFDDQDDDMIPTPGKMDGIDDDDMELDYKSDTDEEDWRSAGVESLRRGNMFDRLGSKPIKREPSAHPQVFPIENFDDDTKSSRPRPQLRSKIDNLKEVDAIQALVQLGSV
ncbi:putative Sin3 binding protein-domain-containing protein [Dipodascopsis tothii]|uniref:putative Sin3 binding protein-domain-containing protein n=1 Tax=Dipodascopsis tothii TaxID=44089 RepID=UPI0034CD3840